MRFTCPVTCKLNLSAEMQSLAVLQAVCRSWKTSLLLLDGQIGCISHASRALSSDSASIRDQCSSGGGRNAVESTTVVAYDAVPSGLASQGLTQQWPDSSKSRQVSLLPDGSTVQKHSQIY